MAHLPRGMPVACSRFWPSHDASPRKADLRGERWTRTHGNCLRSSRQESIGILMHPRPAVQRPDPESTPRQASHGRPLVGRDPVLCQNSVRRVEAGDLLTPQGGQRSGGATISDVKERERNGQPAGAHTAPLGSESMPTLRPQAARRPYRWWRPPTSGNSTISPIPGGCTALGSGQSLSSERCVRDRW